ncbi:hypothetical protein MTO96_030838 [Rhipicephalus appendiculatus]
MSAQSAAQAERMKKRGPGTRRSPGTRHKWPRHDHSTPAALKMPNASDQASAEAAPCHLYALGPSEPVVPGPSPATGASTKCAQWLPGRSRPARSHPLRPSRWCRGRNRSEHTARRTRADCLRHSGDDDHRHRPLSKGSLPPTEPSVHLLLFLIDTAFTVFLVESLAPLLSPK